MKKFTYVLFFLLGVVSSPVFSQTGSFTERMSNYKGPKIAVADCILLMDKVYTDPNLKNLENGDANLAQLRNAVNQIMISFDDFKGQYNKDEWFGLQMSDGFYLSGSLKSEESYSTYFDFLTDKQMNPQLLVLKAYIYDASRFDFSKDPIGKIRGDLEVELQKVGKTYSDIKEFAMYACDKGMVQEVVLQLAESAYIERTQEYKPGKGLALYFSDQNSYLGNAEFTLETCFPAEAQVTLADGSSKSIATIQPEDKLLGMYADGTLSVQNQVLATNIHSGNYPLLALRFEPVSVNFASAHSIQMPVYELVCTPNHPVKTTEGVKQASALQAGDQVYLYDATTQQITMATLVDSQKSVEKATCVYNLKTQTGNYWVNGVLVNVK